MTYQQTIDYLFSQLPMFSRIGAAAYKKDLHNTLELCAALGNPHQAFKSIHIAGTNGKGSTSHMLAAILQKAGYKTGLYTSPHLKDFRERIRVNGEMVEEDFVIEFVEKTKALAEKIQPSFFELTVVMAFEYFARQKVDVAVIETGLGGRLDSTNVITPVLSIITNIGFDHMNLLGNTLTEIAFEKAGIIKPGVPVVIGASTPETRPVFVHKATECNAPIHFAEEQYTVSNIQTGIDFLGCDITDSEHHVTETFSLDLNGLYQSKNLCTVLCAEGILMNQGFSISNEEEKDALSHAKQLTGLHGRWEVISKDPVVILDVAHNEAGIREVMEHLRQSGTSTAKTHIVLGMVKDKDVTKVLALLPADAAYYFTHAHIPRALAAAELQLQAAAYLLNGSCFENVNDAITAAKQKAATGDIILVCGSVFLVGEVE